jgi:hypothetical protein
METSRLARTQTGLCIVPKNLYDGCKAKFASCRDAKPCLARDLQWQNLLLQRLSKTAAQSGIIFLDG